MKKTDILTFSKLFILEDGKPIQVEDWQAENIIEPVFYTFDDNGLRRYNLSLSGLPKKNGKSTLSSLVACYMLLADGEPEPEIYGCAGSRDQAKIIFGQTKKAIERSPILSNEVNIFRDVLERKDGRGFYRVLSSDAPRQHGLNASCTIFDELWNQENYDLFEAMTTSPARKQPITFIVTYSGYHPWEGDLLFDLYSTGKAGTDPGMHFYWTNKNNASWITKKYLDQQRRRLPEHIFRRLHLNEWTTGSGTFLNQSDVDSATDPALSQVFKGQDGHLYHLALDLGLRRDRTAIAVVHKADNGITILDHLKLFEDLRAGNF